MTEPKVSGEYAQAMIATFGEVSPIFERKAATIFEEAGIRDIQPDERYEMSKLSEALHDVVDEVGEKSSEQVGIKQVEISEGFSELGSFEEFAARANEILREIYTPYSPEEVGEFRTESLGGGEYRVSIFGPYPYPTKFVQGVVAGGGKEVFGSMPKTIESTDTKPEESHAFLVER
jgi:hypothetical protein